ncbi:MAG: DoxX family membrane protein [Muribaculaceae bacterium]|nr:DoxX family membrane protein [Muribaculaceae bacterium]
MAGIISRFEHNRYFPLTVWMLRILVGGVFIISGLAKAIDIWGFVFKIEEYLSVWHMMQPRSLVLMGAILLCGYEFVFGLLLLLGCYKRVAVWALTATMAVMLPLSLYLAVANPVTDCGCFGDFWVISNTLTFVKNLIITAALIALLWLNPRLHQGLFQPAIQWIVGAIISLYIVIVALYGYNIQPMIDFRPYPIGARLLPPDTDAAEDADIDDSDIIFTYSKDGREEQFTLDNLPDSTWTFVSRTEPAQKTTSGSVFTVYDRDGNDVTSEAISDEGRELLLVIPEPRLIDISYTYFLNELKQWADSSDVRMVCLIADDRRAMDFLQDVSMATYDIYGVEDTKLKELVRGTMSLVELDNGVVRAKYSLSSIDSPILVDGPKGADLTSRMAPHPQKWFNLLTGGLAALLLFIFLFQSLILTINSRIRAYYQKKHVTLHPENPTDN